MQGKLAKVLSRAFGRNVTVIPARDEDGPELVQMAYYALLDMQVPDMNPDVLRSLAGHFVDIRSNPESGVLVALKKGILVGMVCWGVQAPDVWDGRPSVASWFLYVDPAFRKKPDVALALMRGVVNRGLELGVSKFRVTVDTKDTHLINRYSRVLGFEHESTHHTFVYQFKEV